MEALYEKFHKRVFDYLYKFSGDEDIASDLMQETFLRFFKSYAYKDFSEERCIMLLFTIAKNCSINYHKKFSTIKETISEVDVYKSQGTPFEKREELIDMEERLRQCLLELPEDERTAIILKNIENMTLAEISKVMGVSVSTASRLVVKATTKLVELASKKEINPY